MTSELHADPRTGAPSIVLTERFDEAVSWARVLHASQPRKGTDVPYLCHLLAVSGRVLEDGGDEDQAIAALLHDSIEDQDVTAADIAERFGPEVARIVEACSDTDVSPKPPWRARKEAYLRHLAEADEAVLRVSAADKLHNARAMQRELAELGSDAWDRFNAPALEQRWYVTQLASVIGARLDSPLGRETVATIAQLVAAIELTESL